MKTVWVKAKPWNKKLVTTALEGGADAILVDEADTDKVRALGRVAVIAKNGDMVPGKDVFTVAVKSQEDEKAVVEAAQKGPVIVETSDWTIIPLENLIAKQAKVVTAVKNLDEAVTASGVLEHGAWGILVDTPDALELKKILAHLKSSQGQTQLVEAAITAITPVGMGDRVCVDTCTSMTRGEGMLVGNASSGLFLVHAESVENPYVAPRPFRVNAGAVHAYTRVPGGKTRYLSELASGDGVCVVNSKGQVQEAIVGRVKIERRPLLMVKARANDSEIGLILQNAETIRLTLPDGRPVSVVELCPGDRVLAAVEEGGRHFGHKIKERIEEK
ncbi:MAG: 3-dehydroquinate synthase II [Desulfatibacillaceae bacterium]|nr:3-dehydroquinate synthase II [Desulfatibacillaceae bacterium]